MSVQTDKEIKVIHSNNNKNKNWKTKDMHTDRHQSLLVRMLLVNKWKNYQNRNHFETGIFNM